jgi:hypothetical protein
MVIRGVTFRGTSFDSLSPIDGSLAAEQGIAIKDGALSACLVSAEIPVDVVRGAETMKGVVRVAWDLDYSGDSTKNGIPELWVPKLGIRCRADSEDFEGALEAFSKVLPGDAFIKVCFNCDFSDYSPFGTYAFGSMLCFRCAKGEYLSVRSKGDLIDIMTRAEATQEVFVCPEFVRRTPGRGYRG